MSGKLITDRKFFGGSGSPKFPVGNKTKDESSAMGAGRLDKYEDTTETIKAQQVAGVSKIKGHPTKPLYRN